MTVHSPGPSTVSVRRLRPAVAALCWLLAAAALMANGPAHPIPAPAPFPALGAHDTLREEAASAASSATLVTATVPVMRIRLRSFDVEAIAFGDCLRDSFTVENIGADTLILLPATTVDPARELSIVEGAVEVKIPPDRFVWVVFDYCARRYGCDSSFIILTTFDGSRDSVLIRGCTPDPKLVRDLDTLDFGTVRVGASHRRSYTVPRPVSAEYRIHRIDSSGPGPFELGTFLPTKGIRVPDGEDGKIDVVFTPTRPGAASGLYRILVDGGWQELFVTGQGLATPIEIRPPVLVFPPVAVASSTYETAEAVNASDVSVVVSDIRFEPGPFDLAPGELSSFTLGIGESRQINVRFTPTAIGGFRRKAHLIGATDLDTLASFELVGEGLDSTKPPPVIDRLVWIDTVIANVGDVAALRLRVSPPPVASDTIRRFSAEISYPPAALQVIEALPGRDLPQGSVALGAAGPGRITIDVNAHEMPIIGGDLVVLRVRGLTTGRPANEIRPTRFEFSRDIGPVVIGDGRLFLLGCGVGTIDAIARRVSIRSLSSGSDGSAIVRYTSPAGAAGDARVVDMQGRQISLTRLPAGTGEESEARISLNEVAPGFYLLQLRVADDAVTAPMMVAP